MRGQGFKEYPAYKDAGLPWLDKVPEHWKVTRLKNLLREVDRRSETGAETLMSLSRDRGLIPQSEMTDRPPRAETLEGYKICLPGEIVMNRMQAWNGMFGLSMQEGLVSPDYTVLKPIVDLELEYYVRLFKTSHMIDMFSLASRGLGTGFFRLYTPEFYNICVPFPPPNEQQSIVRFINQKLAQIDQFICYKRRLIELLEEQRTAYINGVVTRGLNPEVSTKSSNIMWLEKIPLHWKVESLGRLAESLQTGPFGSQLHSHEYSPGGIPAINPSHMKDLRIVPDDNCAVDQETWERLKRHALKNGDIIFARRGEMGRCALVTEKEEGWLCGTGSLRMRPKGEKVLSEFLVKLLSTDGVKKYLSLMSVGTTMENLNTNILRQLLLPIPPTLDEQRQIIKAIDQKNIQTTDAISQAEKEIELIQEYRTTLISDAITGKIDVRDTIEAGVPVTAGGD